MSNWLKKIEIYSVLFLIKTLKGLGGFIAFVLIKIGNFLKLAFSLITRRIIIHLFPYHSKLKNEIKKTFATFHYFNGGPFFNPQKILISVLILILVFVFFESRTTFQEDFFAQASAAEEEQKLNPNFKIASEENDEVLKPITIDENFIPTRSDIEKYVVEPGDTISSVAEDFGVSVNTLLWENKLTARSIIKPGQILNILPVSGVSYKVKAGDNAQKISQLYRADVQNIINFNNLDKESLRVGDIIIIPEGKVPPPPTPKIVLRKQEKVWAGQFDGKTRVGTSCRNFYPGQCTWYVAQKVCVPWSGHAKSWLTNAKKYGWAIGKNPMVGAIVSIKESWYGHVAIVEEVRKNTILISEMNHLGPWKVSKRELGINDWRINGYIYP